MSLPRPPPSTIFFLRHGARLDQFNPEWHLTSPTPYDPPLTTKGISQARQTGLAIQNSLPASSSKRIILHTSPFLRCIQTALTLASAIDAKIMLRIDAWLGEWLTTDYFTDIDPPPPSRQLCNSAISGLAGRTMGNVVVDWTWDSLKLGGGGEYGEEWGSMHERFNRGLSRLLQFYQNDSTTTAKEEGDTVVILVTHGAGCNALLGALTRKPVLTDIPVSSLSMAVLRPNTPTLSTSSQFEYELLLQAGTTHLASSTVTSPLLSPSSSRIPDKRILEYHPVRTRSMSSYSVTDIAPPYSSTVLHSTDSGIHRPSLSLRTSSGLFGSSPKSTERTGLWTPSSPSTSAVSDNEDDDGDPVEAIGGRRKRVAGLWRSWAGEQNSMNLDDRGRQRRVSEA